MKFKDSTNKKLIFLKEILFLLIAAIIGAVGIHIFSKNANFAPIGCDGIAIMLSKMTNWSFYIWSLIINIPLIIVGYIFLKKKYVIYTLMYIGFNALFVFILETVNCPSIEVMIHVGQETINDTGLRILSAIFTGISLGIRTGLMLKIGASSGGIDIPACILGKKAKGLNIELIITAISLLVVFLSYFLYKDFISIMLSIIEMIFLTILAGFVQKDLRNALEFKIITKHPEEIKKIITVQFRHGVTVVNSKGGWTDKENTLLITVIGVRELTSFLKALSNIPDTFSYYNQVTGILGNFRWRREDVAK